jgi:hypothetical protein
VKRTKPQKSLIWNWHLKTTIKLILLPSRSTHSKNNNFRTLSVSQWLTRVRKSVHL